MNERVLHDFLYIIQILQKHAEGNPLFGLGTDPQIHKSL